jgi:hypothetical protein
MNKWAKSLQLVIPIGVGILFYFLIPMGFGLLHMVLIFIVVILTMIPIQLYLTIGRPADPMVVRLDSEKIPPEILQFFDGLSAPLAAIGFRPAADLAHLEILGSAAGTSHCRLLKHDAQRDMALLVCQKAVTQIKTYHFATTEFITEFDFGTIVFTNNSKQKPIAFRIAGESTLTIPGLENVELLYRIHSETCARLGGVEQKVVPAEGGEAAFFKRIIVDLWKRRAEAGLYQLNPKSQNYRLTWNGAIIHAWSAIWPLSIIVRLIQKHTIRKKLKALGLWEEVYPG